MTKLTLSNIVNLGGNPVSAQQVINANNQRTVLAMENTLSRNGDKPNHMESDFDLNHYDLLNAARIFADAIFIDGVEISSAAQWNVGSGAPSLSVGKVNDFYLDSNNGDIYGPKTKVWGSPVANIGIIGPVGPEGPAGQSYQPSAVGPTADRPLYNKEKKGFSFFDTTLSQIFFKLSDNDSDWSAGVSLVAGPQGPVGPIGPEGPEGPIGPVNPNSALLQDPSDLKSLAVNGTLSSGGLTGLRTASQELLDDYAKRPSLNTQAAVDLATLMIVPPYEGSTNYIAPNVPFLSYGGSTFRCLPVDLRTVLHNTPIGVPLFKPVVTNGFGHLVWEYTGTEPAYVSLQGSLGFLTRTSGNSPNAYNRHTLRLRSWDHPSFEDGQNNGTRNLSVDIGSLVPPRKFSNYLEFQDRCVPITQALLDNAATWPNLFTTSVNGFFNPGDSTELLRTSDDIGPIDSSVRTTAWMDLATYKPDERAYLFNISGTSTRARVQVKREDGSIYTYDNFSEDNSARKIFRVPTDARFVRIYYSGRGDTAGSESFRPLGIDTSASADPLKGYWTPTTFNVGRDVVFYPGAKYALDIFTTAFSGGSGREWGFRCQGGSLSFNFDAGLLRKTLSTRFF